MPLGARQAPLGSSYGAKQQSGALTLLLGLRQQSHLVARCSGCSRQSPVEKQLFSLAASLTRCQGLCAAEQRSAWGGSLTAGKGSLTTTSSFLLKSCEPASHIPSPSPWKQSSGAISVCSPETFPVQLIDLQGQPGDKQHIPHPL